MQVYRKSILIQLILFIAFLIMGANLIVSFYLIEHWPWLHFVLLFLLVAFAIIGFIIYRKGDERTVVITKREISLIRYLLYGYFGVYILNIILEGATAFGSEAWFHIASGVLCMLVALTGVVIQSRILRLK